MTLICLLFVMLASCNKKTEETEEEIVFTSSSVAIKEFHLQINNNILSNLDSVFFSIDLNRGVIFNADSLPVGTDVTRLIPVITFANTMTQADLVFTTVNNTDTTVNYLTNPSDSINFSSPVTLNVTAENGTDTYKYILKVNVHKQEPDTMIWAGLAVSRLPSRMANPAAQKTVAKNGDLYCLIEENDKTYTLSSVKNPDNSNWTKNEVAFSFTPQISSLSVTEQYFWILSESGELYRSSDGMAWDSTGEQWLSIIGPYLESVLGIKDIEGELWHCHYPANNLIKDTPMASSFPIKGRSDLGIIESDWADTPIAIFIGGLTRAGEISSHTWGFDGNVWATIDTNSLPALDGVSLVKYVSFRKTNLAFTEKEFDAWLAVGGTLADGSFNRTLYLSLDNGITWKKASESMQFPATFPDIEGMNALVVDSDLSANLSDAWTRVASRPVGKWYSPAYELDGYEITWKCPYIYIFGGYEQNGLLSDTIWRGVLARLEFTPLI